MLSINKGLQALGAIPGLQKKNESIYGIFNVSIQFLEAVRIDTHGNRTVNGNNVGYMLVIAVAIQGIQ